MVLTDPQTLCFYHGTREQSSKVSFIPALFCRQRGKTSLYNWLSLGLRETHRNYASYVFCLCLKLFVFSEPPSLLKNKELPFVRCLRKALMVECWCHSSCPVPVLADQVPLSSSLIVSFSVTTEVAFLQELYTVWQPSNGCQCEQKLTYLSGHLKREVIGLESLVSSGKCILEGVNHVQMTDISLSLCISVWSLGEGAPEETEKRDDSQRSTLFVEKPQSGSVSVGKCLATKIKSHFQRDRHWGRTWKVVPVTLSFCPQLQELPLILVGCELHSSKAKRTARRETKNNCLIQDKLEI